MIKDLGKDQVWQQYPIRFYKAVKSVMLFGEEEYFESMKRFAEKIGPENLPGEDGFRVMKLFDFENTRGKDMPPPRYGKI